MSAGSSLRPVDPSGRRVPIPRMRDRRGGLATVIAELVTALTTEGPRRLRPVFEEAIVRVLPLRYARISVGQAIATGSAPTVRERGVIDIPLASGLALLEVGTRNERALDDWEWHTLNTLAQLAALAVEIERAQPTSRSVPAHRTLATCGLVGSSRVMAALRDRIQRVARREVPVLIEGESGVGKELVARQIHELSPRRSGPFVAVNCAALVESLLEAELFGIEDRTATGVRGRRGKFELAEGGTLFLDEVSDLSPPAQAKLLRVVQEHAVERVGGHGTHRVDVRLVAATNRSLTELVEQGQFRMDLFYRLNCVDIQVPPLRARREDIPELVEFFLGSCTDRPGMSPTAEALDAMKAYDWPGNVRELSRAIERAVTLSDGEEIALDHLPPSVVDQHREILVSSLRQQESLRLWGSRYARLILHRCGNNKRQACRVLGITYHTLQAYLRYLDRVERGDLPPGDQ
jgi:transcriptional regulator with PAS, ATPase and Fis domain